MEEKIEICERPQSEDVEFLTEKINEDAQSRGEATEFGIFLRDAEGEILAGCNGSLIFGAIHTDQLWVKKALRGQELGRRLMEKVHAYGREKGCSVATVMTMDFQAPKFYEKLGYQVDFSKHGYAQGAVCIHMSRGL